MQDGQEANILSEIASAVINEPLECLKLAIVDNNYTAGILKNILIKAKHVAKSRIAHVDYYTSAVLPTPKGCDIAIVSTMQNIREFKMNPSPSCKEVVIFQESSGTVKTTHLRIPNQTEGTPISLKLS